MLRAGGRLAPAPPLESERPALVVRPARGSAEPGSTRRRTTPSDLGNAWRMRVGRSSRCEIACDARIHRAGSHHRSFVFPCNLSRSHLCPRSPISACPPSSSRPSTSSASTRRHPSRPRRCPTRSRAATSSAAAVPARARRSRSCCRSSPVSTRRATRSTPTARARSSSRRRASSPTRSPTRSSRWPRRPGCRTRPSSAASGRTRRSRPSRRASTSSSRAPGVWKTSWARASATCPTSRSASSTRPTTWPTWASCPASSAS